MADTRNSTVQLLLAALAIAAAKVAFEFASVLGFIYRGTSFDQPLVAFILAGTIIAAVFVFAIRRLLQRRFVESLILSAFVLFLSCYYRCLTHLIGSLESINSLI